MNSASLAKHFIVNLLDAEKKQLSDLHLFRFIERNRDVALSLIFA